MDRRTPNFLLPSGHHVARRLRDRSEKEAEERTEEVGSIRTDDWPDLALSERGRDSLMPRGGMLQELARFGLQNRELRPNPEIAV